ncbi:MAG: glycosyltransferase family 39 protein, partial [Patescibacteria group bacterium]
MKKHYVLLGSIILVAALLRLFNLTAISLWHDEAFSALLVNYSWQEMFYRIGLDVHPPFYYVILRLWSDLFGHSLFALRGFSVFFGIATIWAVYGFIKIAFKKESLALATALLLAVNPFQIQYVTEARMYTLG